MSMLGWIVRGLRTGVVTTKYPGGTIAGLPRTVPHIDTAYLGPEDCVKLGQICPTGALSCEESRESLTLVLDYAKCVSCALCAEAVPGAVSMSQEFELAARERPDLRTEYILWRRARER